MRTAFKEWAIIVDALSQGSQIIILRKGGISEGRGGFRMDHSSFLLFPTLFHQQRESVLPAGQTRYDVIARAFPAADRLRLECFAEVVATRTLHSIEDANNLRGQHIWRDEVIAERFEWGREQAIHALALRVFRLPRVIELPMLPAYGGCKSWIELDREVGLSGAAPVLTDEAFAASLTRFQAAVGGTDAPSLVARQLLPGQPA